MDVRAVVVMLAVLMTLLQASGQGAIEINLNIGGNTGGSSTADKSQNVVTALLLEQNKKLQERDEDMQEEIMELQERDKKMQQQIKDMQEQIKNLTLDLCLTKKTCCNKTLTCPSGYKRFCEQPDMCYTFSSDPKNYTDARAICQAAGGLLVMPKDQATKDFLTKQLRAITKINIWIGLTDEVTEGTWVWEDGTPLGTGWNNWAPGNPNPNDHAMNCAKLDNSEWSDVHCSSTLHSICEVKATAAP